MTSVLPLTQSDIAMLKARGLDPVLAASLGVRSMPGRGGMVMGFDYRLRGQLHNTKMRFGKGDMPWEQEGKRLILWGIDDLAAPPGLNAKGVQNEAPIFVEGEPDRIAMRMAGFSRVVSVPNGAPSKEGQGGDKRYQYLYSHGDELLPDLAKWDTYIIAVDGDRPGMALRDDLAVRLGDTKCLWVQWPAGCKDANDVLLKHGIQALRDCINGARRMWLDLVCSMSDIPEQPPEEGLPLGFDIMDGPLENDGIRIGETGLCTVVGPAGGGKSTFARQILWNRWRKYGRPFGITALEESARPRYQRIFRRYAIGLPPKDWTHDLVARADAEIEHRRGADAGAVAEQRDASRSTPINCGVGHDLARLRRGQDRIRSVVDDAVADVRGLVGSLLLVDRETRRRRALVAAADHDHCHVAVGDGVTPFRIVSGVRGAEDHGAVPLGLTHVVDVQRVVL